MPGLKAVAAIYEKICRWLLWMGGFMALFEIRGDSRSWLD